MIEQRAVPKEAILAEVLHPQMFRRWLVRQGDRVFNLIPGTPHPVGVYLSEAGGWDPTQHGIHVPGAPGWFNRLMAWAVVVSWTQSTVPAPEVLEIFDAIMRGMDDDRAAATGVAGGRGGDAAPAARGS